MFSLALIIFIIATAKHSLTKVSEDVSESDKSCRCRNSRGQSDSSLTGDNSSQWITLLSHRYYRRDYCEWGYLGLQGSHQTITKGRNEFWWLTCLQRRLIGFLLVYTHDIICFHLETKDGYRRPRKGISSLQLWACGPCLMLSFQVYPL